MTTDLKATSQLFDVANRDDEVIDAVEHLLATLKRARVAKATLADLPPADLRAVLAFRAQARGLR